MRKHGITRLIAGLAVGILMIALPTMSQAATITITNVTVTINGQTWCASGCSTSTNFAGNTVGGTIWGGTALTSGGVTLNGTSSTSLVLTQTAASPFNFDTSEAYNPAVGGGGFNFAGATIAVVTNLGTFTFSDDGKVLSAPNGKSDPGGTAYNEAEDWTSSNISQTGGPGASPIKLWLGYADTAHSAACADVDGNCLPENPWTNASTFIGGASNNAAGQPSGCLNTTFGTTSCFDAGAIRIELTPTPEPSPLILLGMGILGIAFVSRKRAKALLSRS
jgi:hypothetical protein